MELLIYVVSYLAIQVAVFWIMTPCCDDYTAS